MSRSPRRGFEGLNFSPSTEEERFRLLDQCREVILALPPYELAEMIVRAAEKERAGWKRETPLTGSVPHAKESLIEVLAVANALYDPSKEETPSRLRQLTQRWGPETYEYLQPDLQKVAEPILQQIAPAYLARRKGKTPI